MKNKKLKGIVVLLICAIIASCVFFFVGRQKEELKIETKYCDLYYPAKWEKYLLVNELEGDPHMVVFYADIPGMEKQGLFSFCFGNVDEPIGAVLIETGELCYVELAVTPFTPNASWSKENSETVYAMQDDVNYILEKLQLVSTDMVVELEETTESVPEQTVPAVHEDIAVQTPYGVLYYPGEFAEFVQVEHRESEREYLVLFHGIVEEIKYPLFEIRFGVPAEDSIGAITADGNVAANVAVTLFELAREEDLVQEQMAKLMSMQDNVGYMLEKMNLSDVIVMPEEEIVPESESVTEATDLLIETQYGELRYPAKWSEHVRIATIQKPVYSVNFYGTVDGKTELLLFSITYGGEEGYELGSVTDSAGNSVMVRMISEELLLDNDLSEEEKNLIYAMQEDVNYVISALGF